MDQAQKIGEKLGDTIPDAITKVLPGMGEIPPQVSCVWT